MNDSAALKTAPRGAKRSSRHVLTIDYQRGTKRFVDQPPYQEAYGGAHWYYCGYLPALRAHLIGKNENDLASGVLLLDDTGRLIPAGETVYPSADGKRFMAEQQEDGEDGSEWLVAERSGRKLWNGYAGVLRTATEAPGSEPVEYVVASFEAPYWSGDGVLHATATCTSPPQTKGTATFVRYHGRWQWRTTLQCSPNESRGQ